MLFKPEEHLMKLKRNVKDGNDWIQVEDDYLEVKWRLVWFRDKYPNGTIETQEMCVDLDREVTVERRQWNADKRKNEYVMKTAIGYARMKAIVTTGEGGQATGTKTETAVDFPDFIEKAETGAIGRALAALGFGTQFTGGELDEGARIVDSPVPSAKQEKRAEIDPSAITPQQRKAITNVSGLLKREVPALETMTNAEAASLLKTLNAEYGKVRQAS